MSKTVSWAILVLLLVNVLALAFNAQPVRAGPGTIYIRADGSIDPPTAPISTVDNVTYFFTGSINDSIVVERDNIVIDGAGYTVQGTNASDSRGVDLTGRSNVTIKNVNIKAFYCGIYFNSSSGISVIGNNVTANGLSGICLYSSSDSSVRGNNIANSFYGIDLHESSSISVSGNSVANNTYGVYLDDSSNNGVSGNNIAANNFDGIRLDYSSNNSMSGNNITTNNYGVSLYDSSGNSLMGNNIAANHMSGISLHSSSDDNSIIGNNVTANNGYGVSLDSSSNASLCGNIIANNLEGIDLHYSPNNSISGNNITASGLTGIWLYSSSNNTLSDNNVTNNRYGMSLYDSSDNSVYHNNFINNTQQVASVASANVWDNGSSSGGNYWSDYNGTDADHDGIGDTPYVIDANNKDNYPLMAMFPESVPESPWWASPLVIGVIVTVTIVAVLVSFMAFRRKRPKREPARSPSLLLPNQKT